MRGSTARSRYRGGVNEFLDDLGKRLTAVAAERGVTIEAPVLDSKMAAELLDLARVAAHGYERRFAPLASYLAGVATERVRAAAADGAELDLAEMVRAVREALEVETARSGQS